MAALGTKITRTLQVAEESLLEGFVWKHFSINLLALEMDI